MTSKIQWRFRIADPYDGQGFGNPGEYATPRSANSLVRESAQNSLDAGNGPIKMRYTLFELSQAYRADFLAALDYETVLRPHLSGAAATAGKKQVGLRIKRGLKQIDGAEPLRLLRIEDYGTKGLVGEEFGSSPFAALIRNSMDSQKSSQWAGGSYGLGSRTLWGGSSVLTVLFSSILMDREDEGVRVIGKADLPYHKMEIGKGDTAAFRGVGFLGEPLEEDHAKSLFLRPNDPLLKRLFLNRTPPTGETRATGTSILILGFTEANLANELGGEIVSALAKAVARSFWPAMLRGQLEVHMEHRIDETVISNTTVDVDEHVPSLADAYRKHLKNDVVERLEKPGDTVSIPVDLVVPATKEGGGVEPEHDELPAECRLVVRLAEPAPLDASLSGNVGFTRGRGMITKYHPRGSDVGSRSYHAVLLAGTIAGDGETQEIAETFLRWSEPPAHDDWTGKDNNDVYERYAWGLGQKLETFKTLVFAKLREATTTPPQESSEGPEILRESFKLRTPPTESTPKWKLASPRVTFMDPEYEVTGIIVVEESAAGTLTPTLGIVKESGGTISAKWSHLESPDAPVNDGSLQIPGPGRYHFKGRCLRPNEASRLKFDRCAVQVSVSLKPGAEA